MVVLIASAIAKPRDRGAILTSRSSHWLASSPDAIPVSPTVVKGCDSLGDTHPSASLYPTTHSGVLAHHLLVPDGVPGRLNLLSPLPEALPTTRALGDEATAGSLADTCVVLHTLTEVMQLSRPLEDAYVRSLLLLCQRSHSLANTQATKAPSGSPYPIVDIALRKHAASRPSHYVMHCVQP